MMVIQTPGSFLWAGSLAARLGSRGWSSWGVFIVTGCLQGCLLVMGVVFELRKRKRAVARNGEVVCEEFFPSSPIILLPSFPCYEYTYYQDIPTDWLTLRVEYE